MSVLHTFNSTSVYTYYIVTVNLLEETRVYRRPAESPWQFVSHICKVVSITLQKVSIWIDTIGCDRLLYEHIHDTSNMTVKGQSISL